MKPNNLQNASVPTICENILLQILQDGEIELDKLNDRVAPGRKIYYHYTLLRDAGMVANQGRTKPLVLSLTNNGCERAEQIKARRSPASTKSTSLVSVPKLAELPKITKVPEFNPAKFEELAQLHLRIAALLERIAQLHGDVSRKAA